MVVAEFGNSGVRADPRSYPIAECIPKCIPILLPLLTSALLFNQAPFLRQFSLYGFPLSSVLFVSPKLAAGGALPLPPGPGGLFSPSILRFYPRRQEDSSDFSFELDFLVC